MAGERPPQRVGGERLQRTQSFLGDDAWWQQKLPMGRNSWGAICLGEASGLFHYPFSCIVRGLAADRRRFTAEGTEGNQLALV